MSDMWYHKHCLGNIPFKGNGQYVLFTQSNQIWQNFSSCWIVLHYKRDYKCTNNRWACNYHCRCRKKKCIFDIHGYFFGSVAISTFIDNIPYVATMLQVLGSLSSVMMQISFFYISDFWSEQLWKDMKFHLVISWR